jgi:RHH-type proline utilization regulon transcriptional repressor/proline dehydrogenase/delta 1-pyrroline-5-carboxylate dehydrogenase
MPQTAAIESLTRRIGQEIFARAADSGPVPFGPTWWDDRLMDLTMSNEALKLQLFRFVDALPQLNTPESIVRHLREYIAEAGPSVPWWARLGVRLLPAWAPVAWVVRWSARRLARKFIAGSNIAEATSAIERMRARDLTFTVDLLGEATLTEAEAEQSQRDYIDMIEGLSPEAAGWREKPLIDSDDKGPLPRVNVSVKLSALYSQFDPIDPEGTSRAVRARLRPVLHAARQNGAFVNIDMEQYTFKDTTIRIFEEILDEPDFRDWPDCGLAMQAYLRDTEEDLHRLAGWAKRRGTPVWVRLVKGAYWDYETVTARQQGWPIPVWQLKWESDFAYERCTRFMLDNRHLIRPAFGSHNIRSLSHAIAAAKVLGLPPGSIEIQMLYGMADPVKDVLAGMGQRVRVYTPYGELIPGMAYLVRRLLENTANESFLRAGFVEGVSPEKLLRNPAELVDA